MKTMKRKKIELLRKSHRQPTIDFIRIREGAQIPARATRDAAGYDLSSAESCTVPSGGRGIITSKSGRAVAWLCAMALRCSTRRALSMPIIVANSWSSYSIRVKRRLPLSLATELRKPSSCGMPMSFGAKSTISTTSARPIAAIGGLGARAYNAHPKGTKKP